MGYRWVKSQEEGNPTFLCLLFSEKNKKTDPSSEGGLLRALEVTELLQA